LKEREEFETNRISVIVPVYKSENVLKRCVDSILSQTYKNLEVILVDDGSPDASGRICDNYAEYDSRVRVIHKRNSGVAAARNSGLDIATGDYCTFVDSDDYIDPSMYHSMMKIMKQYKCDLVMCDCIKEYTNKKEIYTHDIRSGYYNREQIEKEYAKKGETANILIEVNMAQEESKFGITSQETEELIRKISTFEHIRIKGLMTIAPYTDNPETNRVYFRQMKKLSVDIRDKNIDNVSMDVLSMGMTGDYQVAIEEGSTMVRVGTGIFGERNYNI